jgi:cytochrome c oxidase cbb3-type subunit IV
MSPVWGHAIGVIIVLLMLIFIGIWIWAWLPFHKKTFDALARIPLHDDKLDAVREDEQP